MKTLSLGKFRGLQECSTLQNKFVILAIDHRNNLRKLLNISSKEENAYEKIVQFKIEIVDRLSKYGSAVLVEPEFSAAQCITNAVIPSQTGLIVSLEETGYRGTLQARESDLLSGWNIDGASGAAIGRAVWKEATPIEGEGRENFLRREAITRLKKKNVL